MADGPPQGTAWDGPGGLRLGHLGGRQRGAQGEQPLEVVRQRHQRPFRAHVLETAQAEGLESPGRFDDAEDRLDGLFALRRERASSFGSETMFRVRLGAGSGARWWRGCLLREPLEGAPVGLSPGRSLDHRIGLVSAPLLRIGYCGGAVKRAFDEHRPDILDHRG